jgi:Tetratricopeptide repeat
MLNQGDLAGAEPLLERALAIRETVLGPHQLAYWVEPTRMIASTSRRANERGAFARAGMSKIETSACAFMTAPGSIASRWVARV